MGAAATFQYILCRENVFQIDILHLLYYIQYVHIWEHCIHKEFYKRIYIYFLVCFLFYYTVIIPAGEILLLI